MNKIIRYLLITLLIFVIISTSLTIFIEILKPAYLSYANVCIGVNVEDYGYYTAGQTNTSSSEIIIYIDEETNPKLYDSTLKHECVHVNQIERGEITCRNLYFLELEAYTFQNLPNKVFPLFYNTDNC